MDRIFQNISKYLVIWFSLLFISPLFGIHIHHLLPSTLDEITIIHSYYETDHPNSSQPNESEAQPLFEHISPYGISTDLGNWDGSLAMDMTVFFFILSIILLLFAYTTLEIFFMGFRLQSHIICQWNPFLRISFYRKSYLYNCLLNHLPPPFSYN